MTWLGSEFTPDELKKQLEVLSVLKRNGKLDDEIDNTNDVYWRSLVTYDSLERCVTHYDDNIKLSTLALVVVSKKSTLSFTSKELDIIILFLRVNLKEKIVFVPIIKKALKRIKGSLAVMKRQCIQEEKLRAHYRKSCNPLEMNQKVLDDSYKISSNLQDTINKYSNTFETIRNMCICSPDATYNKRKSSLEILLVMRDILDDEFKNISWKSEQVESLFNLMLLDTYETNKEKAFCLIKSVDPDLLQLNNENRVFEIITVAIELGNSIRPIDSVTAASMFKVSLLSPIVHLVLEKLLGLTRVPEDVTDATLLQLILILLEKLKDSLAVAKENIVKTVTKHSLYGYLFCIRSLLQECTWKSLGKEQLWQNTIEEVISICFEFSHAVSPIVNNSSPEGHLPMDLNIETVNELCGLLPEKQIVTPQMVLLCSWRTIKEVSLLFGLLASKAPICEDNLSIGLLNKEQIIKIGKHLVLLLTEIKHRGAFEQAHIGFSQLCFRLWRLDKLSLLCLNELPKLWLHQILAAIIGIEDNSKLCATRRSAGVPFVIQAILSTQPRQHKDTKTPLFDSVMKILLELTRLHNQYLLDSFLYSNSEFRQYKNSANLANAEVTEIKTHALNVLRGIFRHSDFAKVVSDYVEDGLIATFKCDHASWAERNAATLLFSALIIRIFGVQRTKDHINLTADNKMNYTLFFKRYRKLFSFFTQEMEKKEDTLIKSNVQSILLLLSRLYHSHDYESNSIDIMKRYIDGLAYSVSLCGRSAVFETRKLAARALIPLLTEGSAGFFPSYIVAPIKNCVDCINYLHGLMLQLHEIIKYFNFKSLQNRNINWNKFLRKTIWILINLEKNNSKYPCFVLAEVYVNVCSEIYRTDKMNTIHVLSPLNAIISHLLEEELKEGPARELYKLSAMKFVRSIAKETSLIHQCTLINVYLHNLTVSETQVIAWSNIIKIIDEVEFADISLSFLNYAINEAYNLTEYLHEYSPEMQDAIFDFLYNSLTYLNRIEPSDSTRRVEICKFVLNKIRLNNNKKFYCERDCYLRLLGKSYVTLEFLHKDEEAISSECSTDVYTNICDYLWIANLNEDFIGSIFEILQDLFLACYKKDNYRYMQVQWWTAVWQLLLDNNSNVRHKAFLLVDQVPVDCNLSSDISHLNLLLSKFYECNINSKNPEFMCVVLFYWSIGLSDDIDYEMDDTDVFNKCNNYDFLEPVEVAKTCAEFLMKNMKNHIDLILPDDITNWINNLLNVEFRKSITFRTFVKDYGSYVPAIENKLHDILNPMYKNKLLQILAYEEYKKIL